MVADSVDGDRGLYEFLSRWYGSPVKPPRLLPGDWPLPLRRWYAYTEAWEHSLTHQNFILPIDDLRVVDGKTVFYVENQAVWLWAFAHGPDPEVFDRPNPSDDWVSTGECLADFLVHLAVVEAAMSDSHALVANDMSKTEADRALAGLTPCRFVRWRWPGPQSAVWQRGDLVAMTGANQLPALPVTPDSHWFLFVGGQTAEALRQLDRFGIDWDYDSRIG
jgi:hypothetical protein